MSNVCLPTCKMSKADVLSRLDALVFPRHRRDIKDDVKSLRSMVERFGVEAYTLGALTRLESACFVYSVDKDGWPDTSVLDVDGGAE